MTFDDPRSPNNNTLLLTDQRDLESGVQDWRPTFNSDKPAKPHLVVDNSQHIPAKDENVIQFAIRGAAKIIGTFTREIFNAAGKVIGVQYKDGSFYRRIKEGGEIHYIPFKIIK